MAKASRKMNMVKIAEKVIKKIEKASLMGMESFKGSTTYKLVSKKEWWHKITTKQISSVISELKQMLKIELKKVNMQLEI